MSYFLGKVIISGIIVAIVSEVAERQPELGALIASLPLISILGMIWLWHASPDIENMAAHAKATFWFVPPSLPMILLMPVLLYQGVLFWGSIVAGCLLTIFLYSLVIWLSARLGLSI